MTNDGIAARRQAAIAELGELVLQGILLDDLIAKIVDSCSELLPSDFVSVMELLPPGDELFVRAGRGWNDGIVGAAKMPNDLKSQSGFTLQTDEPVLVEDINTESRFKIPQLLIDHAIRSGISVVIRGSDRPFGVLSVQSKTPGAFDANQAQFVRSVANVLGSAIQQLKHEVELSTLANISRVIASSSNISDVFPLFAEQVTKLISFDRISISIVDWRRGIYSDAYVSGLSVPGIDIGEEININQFALQKSLEQGENHILQEAQLRALAERSERISANLDVGLKSCLFVPLKYGSEIAGVMFLWSSKNTMYSERDLALAQRVADQIAGVVANAQLRDAVSRESEDRAVLAEISRAITSTNYLGTAFTSFSELVNKLVLHERIVISLIGEGNDLTDIFVTGTPVPGREQGSVVPLAGTISEYVFRKGSTVVYNASTPMDLLAQFDAGVVVVQRIFCSVILVPLKTQDEIIGLLHLWTEVPDAYSDRDVANAEQVASQITGAIENEWSRRNLEKLNSQLEASEENYRDLVESSHDLIWRCDAEGRFTYLNPAWERTHGYKVEEMLGRPFTDFQTPETAERDQREFGRHLAGGSVLDYESSQITKSGNEVTLLFNAFPIFDDDGEIVGTRGTARDITAERKTQEKLVTSEENYRDLVESSHDLIWRVDAEGRFTYLNPAWERSLGYTAYEMLGRPFSDFQTEEWAKHDSEEFAQNLTGIPAVNYETRYLTKTGKEVILLFSALSVSDANSVVTGAKGVARDITNERTVQENLAASEENYRDLVESSHDLIWRCDAEGRFTYVNPAWERTLHYTADEMLGRPFTDFQTKEWAERDIDEFASDMVGEAARDFETHYLTKSGEDVILVFNALHVEDSDGVVIGAKGTARDITDQTRAEEELRIRITALDAAVETVVITNSDGTIEYVNKAFTKQTGYPREEAIGANPRVLKSGRHDATFYSDLWETITAGKVWGSTLINRRKDGSEYPEEMTITPVMSDNGEVLRFIAIKRDITERIRAAAERDAARDLEAEHRELQRVNEARSEFLSTVSHELRTPLTTMLAFSDILKRNRTDNLSERQLEHLELISSNGHRLNELIDDLLDVSRSETGQFRLEFAPFDMGETIEEVVRACGSVFDDRDQTLKVVDLPVSVRIDGDRARIVQVLNNLLTNAAKYSSVGATTEMVASVEDDIVQIEVSDHGIGISQEDQQRLFVPFFRAANTETRKESGTGLGLVIVKTIVELHGGNVEVESQQNVGTTVRIRIPGILPASPG